MNDIEQELVKINRRLDDLFTLIEQERVIPHYPDTRAQGMSGILAKGTNSVIQFRSKTTHRDQREVLAC